jgi:hypothetical protein
MTPILLVTSALSFGFPEFSVACLSSSGSCGKRPSNYGNHLPLTQFAKFLAIPTNLHRADSSTLSTIAQS